VTLTLDRVILHTFMHHSSTSAYILNFSEIKESFCGWTDVRRTYGRADGHLRPALLGRSTRRSRPKIDHTTFSDIGFCRTFPESMQNFSAATSRVPLAASTWLPFSSFFQQRLCHITELPANKFHCQGNN